MEVMVQGPQIKHVTKYLIDTKGFPEKYIKVTNLIRKSGKTSLKNRFAHYAYRYFIICSVYKTRKKNHEYQ